MIFVNQLRIFLLFPATVSKTLEKIESGCKKIIPELETTDPGRSDSCDTDSLLVPVLSLHEINML
jgi:hypothetical protein